MSLVVVFGAKFRTELSYDVPRDACETSVAVKVFISVHAHLGLIHAVGGVA